jgi:hypothetical protein
LGEKVRLYLQTWFDFFLYRNGLLKKKITQIHVSQSVLNFDSAGPQESIGRVLGRRLSIVTISRIFEISLPGHDYFGPEVRIIQPIRFSRS